MPDTTDTIMTTEEVAAFMHVSRHTVARWHRDGRLPKYTIAGLQSVRFKRSDVEALLTAKE